ncbi:IS3 family transposase [Candidatus Palauibacter sp.]|uniref:IS3 family transposase n=1 Tax=Candidatus Palauibacter sp. TaxID=3101350 RepID=UPI003B58C24E
MSGRRYAPEYKARMVELVRAGRSADQLAREFEPSATAIRRWVEQADLDEGRRTDGLTTAERKEVRELKRELRRVKIERDILAKGHGLVRQGERIDPPRGFRFAVDHQAMYPVRVMCRLLGLSPSGYYAWRKREPSRRARENAALSAEIVEIHAMSGGTYGAPRVHAELKARGREASVGRVARLMRAAGVEGVSRRRKGRTTKRAAESKPAPDLVERDFSASGADELWVADITYVPTWAGWLYLAVVLDAWSRRIVGWSMATHLRTSLVLDAFDMALAQRRPEGVIHHSDQGSQYTSYAFGGRCRRAGVRPSMGSVGDAYDNAMCESFFATLECELIWRRSFRTPGEARREVFRFIEGWYNPRRRHSSLGYESPASFEAREKGEAA